MAGITNDKLLETLNIMAADVAIIKEVIRPLPDMYKDLYIGNGEPPLRETCREFLADKKCKETAVTVALADKKDDNKWFKRSVIGVVIVQTIGMIFAYIK